MHCQDSLFSYLHDVLLDFSFAGPTSTAALPNDYGREGVAADTSPLADGQNTAGSSEVHTSAAVGPEAIFTASTAVQALSPEQPEPSSSDAQNAAASTGADAQAEPQASTSARADRQEGAASSGLSHSPDTEHDSTPAQADSVLERHASAATEEQGQVAQDSPDMTRKQAFAAIQYATGT